MADFNQINQFGSAKPIRSGEGTSCAECEAMLMDALDGSLTAKQQAAFDRHIATCAECSQMLADAQRGAAMLEVLKFYRPEPSAGLVERILAQTSGQASAAAAPVKSQDSGILAIPGIDGAAVEIHSIVPATVGSAAVPAYAPAGGKVLPFRRRVEATFNLRAIGHTMMQPRLAMTAAMAFFSIALTLNLTGVHLNELRASDLAPSNLKRSFYHANASVVRYYDNLRVVYELESKLNEFRRTNPGDGSVDHSPDDPPVNPTRVAPERAPDKTSDQEKPRKAPKAGSGTSERRSPSDELYKLAGWSQATREAENIAEDSAVALTSNKTLKESLQKGDLV